MRERFLSSSTPVTCSSLHKKEQGYGQGCGSGSRSGMDPDPIGSVDPDPDPGGQKLPTKVEIFFKVPVLKCWMATFESGRLLL